MVALNSAKGSAFILVTAIILFLLVYAQLRQVQGAQQRYVGSVQELEAAHEELTATDEELRQQFEELTTQTSLVAEKDREIWAMFENMHDAFALHEMICDESGNPIDYRFLAVNPAYEKMLGIPSTKLLWLHPTHRSPIPRSRCPGSGTGEVLELVRADRWRRAVPPDR